MGMSDKTKKTIRTVGLCVAAAGNNGVPTSDGARYFGGKYETLLS